jgi:NADPH:quinone reductase
MKVVEVREYGGPEVLAAADRPEPVAAPGRVRVRVAAATVNPADLWTRAGALQVLTPGLVPPFVLGWDLAGTVLEDAGGFTAGQAVVGDLPWFDVAVAGIGAYAEVVTAEPAWLAPLPAGLDPVAAATLGLNGPTAAQGLALVGARPGETLLVTGASGGVGGFAVQLAAAAGVRVLAVAAGQDDEAYVKGLGAEQVLPRTAADGLAAVVRDVLPGGVDAVFDAASGGPAGIGAVRDGGVFVAVTDPGTPAAERGVRVGKVGVTPDPAELAELAEALAAGRLTTRVADVLPLDRAADAHRRLAAGGVRGKLVLVP